MQLNEIIKNVLVNHIDITRNRNPSSFDIYILYLYRMANDRKNRQNRKLYPKIIDKMMKNDV